MSDVKWIKVYTNMVSNKKIKRIRTLPEGNNIILIWVFLLAQAGESNRDGALYLTDTIPFRAEDLAIEFDFEVSVINLALITLEKFSMIEAFEEVIYIKNWSEYQNIDGLEKIKEQNRERKRRERLKKNEELLLSDDMSRDSHVTCHVTVTQCHATDIDTDKELDIELDKENSTTLILTADESAFISVLGTIEGYPLDRVRDLEMYKTLGDRYPTIDLLEAIKDWAVYKLDHPLKKSENPRSQINTSFKNCVKWGKNIKKGGNQLGRSQGSQSIDDRIRDDPYMQALFGDKRSE